MAEEVANNNQSGTPPVDMNFPQPGDLPGGRLGSFAPTAQNLTSDQFQMPEPQRPLSYREQAVLQAQARGLYQEQLQKSPTMNIPQPQLPQTDTGFPQLDAIQPTRENVLNMLDRRFATMDNRISNDVMKFGKAMNFNANDPTNMNQFKQRYQEHSAFEELGFSPFRDNDALYNANSSWTQDLGRAAGQWAELTGMAMVDMTGFGPQSDHEIARKQEQLFAIGSSTRGGLGGFATNFVLNSGTTVGIMAELAAETLIIAAAEAALGISTAASGGTVLASHRS